MDRKQAQDSIGKLIVINEGQDGSYIGELNNIIAPPRKTWRGTVTIKGVVKLPELTEAHAAGSTLPLKYEENEVVECIGSKLDLLEDEELAKLTFADSLSRAAHQKYDELEAALNITVAKQNALTDSLQQLGMSTESSSTEAAQTADDLDSQSPSISYTFMKQNGRFILTDAGGEALDLEDCPFEFGWHDKEPTTGYYEGNGVFLSEDGTPFAPEEGTVFTISEDQFEPYFILRNELEPEALQSLEVNMKAFGITHDHLLDCQNTLLGQFLNADGQRAFKGVNFLTYRGRKGFVMVQHHFERKLHEQSNDEIYDRFEFTGENGKRSIATFTNEYSK